MHRRHQEFDQKKEREHDIDLERENQRLKTELQTRESETQLAKREKVNRMKNCYHE